MTYDAKIARTQSDACACTARCARALLNAPQVSTSAHGSKYIVWKGRSGGGRAGGPAWPATATGQRRLLEISSARTHCSMHVSRHKRTDLWAGRGARVANETTTATILLCMNSATALQGDSYPWSCERHAGKARPKRRTPNAKGKSKIRSAAGTAKMTARAHTRLSDGSKQTIALGWMMV